MLNSIFSSILSNGTFTGTGFVAATISAFVCGLIIAFSYMVRGSSSKSFITTLVLLPAIVELVIILVNGNIGAGVAVAGAFSLVRFRSVPGRGQEITGIFLAMAAGLATGMGYIGVAVIFTFIVSGVSILLNSIHFGDDDRGERLLRITIPEDMDYEGRFEEVFGRYLKKYSYDEVRTTNMGSLYRLSLSVTMKDSVSSKGFLDELRTLNGNLDISLGRMIESADTL